MKKISGIALLLILFAFNSFSQIYYVDAARPNNSGAGTSWSTAKKDLQEAINTATSGSQIWVKKATYKPTKDLFGDLSPRDPRERTFYLKDGVKIYGGFAGNETSLAQRNITNNTTILSGDFDGNDVVSGSGAALTITGNNENAFHVVVSVKDGSSTVLDGFTIKGGNATSGKYEIIEDITVHHTFGGGLFNFGSNLLISNITFSSNVASQGGGIYNEGTCRPTIFSVIFSGNVANLFGGGMGNAGSSPNIDRCDVSGNLAQNGGGIYNDFSTPTISIINLSSNTASSSGGGMYNNNSKPVIHNCSISRNLAVYGGGMFNSGNTPLITETPFSNNIATGSGGGIYNQNSSPIITDATFSGNSAEQYGGGMFNESNSKPSITHAAFRDNTAGQGGGMFNLSSSPSIINTILTGNTAVSDGGGGMYNFNSSNPTIINSTFSSNTANMSGGGMGNSNGSSPSIANTIFYRNTSKRADGGGMSNRGGSSPSITNTTFCGNTSNDAGGIMSGGMSNAGGSNASIKNSIFWLNKNGTTIASIGNSSSTPSVSYSLVEGGYTGIGNINADPSFHNLTVPAGPDGIWMTADDGLRLTCFSQAINAGTIPSPAIPTDILGNDRVYNYDIGAYEYQGSSQTVSQAITGSMSESRNQVNTQVYGLCGGLIASLQSNGTNPITGSTTAIVWIEVAQNSQFVKRHYEITPATNATTATGRVTIYFTQQEFTDFNAINTVKLPTSASDAAGKANLIIEKRGGKSSNLSGLPATYSGDITTINPDDANIVWNATASRWEVTFDVTGFSGFFVKTSENSLPVSFGDINAVIENGTLTVNWQTLTEINNDHFEIEASQDGVNFTKIATIASKAENGNSSSPLQYRWEAGLEVLATISWIGMILLIGLLPVAHRYKKQLLMASVVLFIAFISCSKRKDNLAENPGGKYFIRIAQVDKDGGKTYSKIVSVVN